MMHGTYGIQRRRVVANRGREPRAADFVVTPEGRHVFLEVNPSGEWFWLDPATGCAKQDRCGMVEA